MDERPGAPARAGALAASATLPADLTGRYAWPAGQRLMRDLPAILDCRGLCICDIGCGSGALGCAALAAGAATADFCDADPGALEHATAGAAALGALPRARTHVHLWGAGLPRTGYDAILGGDVLYREAWQAALIASIASGLAPHGIALLSDPRTHLETDLPALARARGLGWNQERRSDFTLVRIQWADSERPHTGVRT